MLLFGFYAPLSLLICMPVSFCVFYWDTPLEGWHSGASKFGEAVLLCNVLLCLAYLKSYRAMFTLQAQATHMKQLVLGGRIVFGAWMLLNSANYLFLALWPAATGHTPLAIQLMTSLVNSQLLDVAMWIQLVTGALILAGLWAPAALCVLMPVTTCALYWTLLDQQPLPALLALVAFALNGLLMLAYLPSYHGSLQRSALAFGEDALSNHDALLVNPNGRTSRAEFVPALVVVLAVMVFYAYVIGGRNAQFCILTLLYPAFVLMARRLHDMGKTAWPLLMALAIVIVAMAVRLHYFSLGDQIDGYVLWIALVVTLPVALWGCVKK